MRSAEQRPRNSRTGHRWLTIRYARADARSLITALTHLPQVYRVPVILRDIQGLSTEEASAILRSQTADAEVASAPWPSDSPQHLGEFAGGLALHGRESTH
jgi:DNA-directed RNA polymerase specialized sigma24 family protein